MSTTLKEFLTEIADAIREKTGSTEPINAQNFATEIESIETDGGETDDSGTYYYKYVSSGGTAIPNDGTQVSKIYFNTKMGDINGYIKNANLTFIDYGGMIIYPILLNTNTYDVYFIITSGEGEYAIYISNLITNQNTEIWFDVWSTDVISSDGVLSFGSPATTINNFQGLPVGAENEKIKALISFEDNFVNQKEKCSTEDIINNLGVELVSDLEIIDDYASPYRITLTSIDLPNATSIGEYAFQYCDSLTSVNIPNATTIGDYAFIYCEALTSIDLPNVTIIYSHAFDNCTSLASINLPSVTSVNYQAFQYCKLLTSLNLPSAITIGDYAFTGCEALTSLNLPSATSIGERAFYYCRALTIVILRSTTLCALVNINVFDNTPIATSTTEGFIYVPDGLVEDYKVATNWSTFASKIKAISELEE